MLQRTLSSVVVRALVVGSLGLALAACGRSSLLGGDGGGCPPGTVAEGDQCVPVGDGGVDGDNCQARQEICNNGVDDNCNGLVDCNDPECSTDPSCQSCSTKPEICNNGVDDNCNGLVDCQDPACKDDPSCAMDCGLKPEICNNGIDDNCNGLVDCMDPQCKSDPSCQSCSTKRENCTNGIDDNCNGLVDCKDPECNNDPACQQQCSQKQEICDNGIDDNCNGLTDCQDPECAGTKTCCMQKVEICDNGVDDNCNGLVDCQDPACAGAKNCNMPGNEICNNGIDDDHNGLTDCQDPACFTFPGCQQHMCTTPVDCSDPLCNNVPQCQDLVCKPTVDFGTLQKNDSKSEKTVDTTGTKDLFLTPCAPGGGGMVVTEFTVASNQTAVELSFAQAAGADHVFALFEGGVLQACNANPVGCYDPKGAMMGTHTWPLDAGHYYLVVQAFTQQHQGKVDITLSTPPSAKKEICNNGVDDDGNGLIDCQDPACFNDPSCNNKECVPDIKLGALVLGDAPKSASFDTNQSTAMRDAMDVCGGTGGDEIIEFTLGDDLDVEMTFQETTTHAIGLWKLPPPGQSCVDATPLSCYVPNVPGTDVDWGQLPPGDYIFVFKALKPGAEGHVDMTLQANQTRKVELCHNGIDDDNNGFTDCADPACFNDPGCGPPVCSPDVNFGALPIGGIPRTAQLDLTNGIPNEKVSCAQGSGKSRVVQFTLTENAGVVFECDYTNSDQYVMALDAEQGPRDSCDKFEVDCADPGTIPFGCNFEIPNIQPGTYYVIAQQFKLGSASEATIRLSAVQDTVLEICNNGIDDDHNGFTDCADIKCATSPYCSGKACMPAATIDPMPLDGTARYALLQTAGAQVTSEPPCETIMGGGDAVVMVNMPATATLNIGYSQLGEHVFAVYPDEGAGTICDAAPSLACTPTSGANNSGMVSFPKLAAGKYWVVMAADKPGDEGSASLKFTAMP